MISRTTAEWQSTKKWLTDKIGEAHVRLEHEADAMAAAAIRGEIAAYRKFIAEVEPVVVPTTNSPSY